MLGSYTGLDVAARGMAQSDPLDGAPAAMSAGLPDDQYARLVQPIVENPMLDGSVIRLDGAARMPAKWRGRRNV